MFNKIGHVPEVDEEEDCATSNKKHCERLHIDEFD